MNRYEVMTGISVEEAVKRLLDEEYDKCGTICLSVNESYGMITAEDCVAGMDVPAFPRSAMDGYAVSSRDTLMASCDFPLKLKVSAIQYAGDADPIVYEKGTAVRIMTGGRIPDGYDAVIKQEDTDLGEREVTIYAPVEPYMNYCPVGENIKNNETVIRTGKKIGRTEAGLLAMLGKDKIKVIRPLRIALIATGSELLRPGDELKDGMIYSSISPMIVSSLKAEKMEIVYDDVCPDYKDRITDSVKKALDISDILITTGGVSVGKRDLLHEILDDIGAKKLFYGVDIQPGTPTIASVINKKPVLSLSGNPYAALVNFDLYFWEIAARLTGCDELKLQRREASLTSPSSKVNKMRRFVRGYYEGGSVTLTGGKNRSSVISDLTGCNCYVDMEKNRRYEAGEKVEIVLMKG
ncbi:MAG: molybdopterin molybdotransferase MoeA [Lachnospiraceae bacterium]|nr:molybdopterin molybdotransferase MoeA [Lachnospiraceae bacterium]